jgi:hypothetical protein
MEGGNGYKIIDLICLHQLIKNKCNFLIFKLKLFGKTIGNEKNFLTIIALFRVTRTVY